MALSEVPFVLVFLFGAVTVLFGLIDALRHRSWGWAALQVGVPGLATAVYLMVVRRDREGRVR